jgi:hypothetical protein
MAVVNIADGHEWLGWLGGRWVVGLECLKVILFDHHVSVEGYPSLDTGTV